MKKINAIVYYVMILLSISITSKSQISLENTYPSSGFYNTVNAGAVVFSGTKQFYMVKLEVSGDKYVCIDLQGQNLKFYNLDHSLFASVSYSNVSLFNSGGASILEKNTASIMYISQNLFDTDNQIEFLYTYNYNNTSSGDLAITQIVNEDGSIIFTANNEAPLIKLSQHNQYYPIYNTSAGTKMILSNTDGSAKVYSLGGTFTNVLKYNDPIDLNMKLFPNPSGTSELITLEYSLPQSIKTADLKIYNSLGQEIKSYRIGNDMDKVLVDPKEIGKGTYYYTIFSGSTVIGTKTSVIVE